MEYSAKIRINGVQVNMEDLPKEEAQKLIHEMIDRAMRSIGFKKSEKAA